MRVGECDKKENARVKRLLKRARASHPHIRLSSVGAATFHGTRAARQKVARQGFIIGAYNPGYSSAAALGDAVRAKIVANEEYESRQGKCRILARGGYWLVPPAQRFRGWQAMGVKEPCNSLP